MGSGVGFFHPVLKVMKSLCTCAGCSSWSGQWNVSPRRPPLNQQPLGFLLWGCPPWETGELCRPLMGDSKVEILTPCFAPDVSVFSDFKFPAYSKVSFWPCLETSQTGCRSPCPPPELPGVAGAKPGCVPWGSAWRLPPSRWACLCVA